MCHCLVEDIVTPTHVLSIQKKTIKSFWFFLTQHGLNTYKAKCSLRPQSRHTNPSRPQHTSAASCLHTSCRTEGSSIDRNIQTCCWDKRLQHCVLQKHSFKLHSGKGMSQKQRFSLVLSAVVHYQRGRNNPFYSLHLTEIMS